MSPHTPASTSYRIEISGWDVSEGFFVENTDLDWSEEDGKKVLLRHRLRDGAVVFVRLVHQKAAGQSYPIAYQVEDLNLSEPLGMWQFRLVQLHPRPGAHTTRANAPAELVEEKRG